MKKNYNLLLKKTTVFTVFIFISLTINAQVGVGTTTPDAQLDIVTTATTGNGLQVNHDVVTNGSSASWIRNSGIGYGIHSQTLSTANNLANLRILQLGTGAFSRGVQINMDSGTISEGLTIFNDGAGIGIYNELNGT